MDQVYILNDRFGMALGRPNGADPRFAWKLTKDLHYYYRDNPSEDWQRRSWADRVGNCWVLAEWRPPEVNIYGITQEITREQWFTMFGWSRPYPQGGEYKPYTETALPRIPNEQDTAFYIKTITKQLSDSEAANKDQLMGRKDAITEQCERDAQAVVDRYETEFMESVADWQPISWRLNEPYNPGDQDGPVSFGGIDSNVLPSDTQNNHGNALLIDPKHGGKISIPEPGKG